MRILPLRIQKLEREREREMAFSKGFAVMIFLAAAMFSGGSAQPACVSNLLGCANYLNSTTPPPSCCDPLKDALKNQLPCLCSLFQDKDLFKQFHINMTQALQLPEHCGVPGDVTSSCKSESAPSPTAGSPPDNGKSDAGKLARTGVSTLIGALLLWASMVVPA